MNHKLDPLNDLKSRQLVHQMTDEKALSDLLRRGKGNFYCGFDPTADSLHVGHLLLITCAKRLQSYGLTPYILLGEATGRVGDPSFKKEERELKNTDILHTSALSIKRQLRKLLPGDADTEPHFVNNLQWSEDLKLIDFLRDIGKHFHVQSMVKRDAIKERMGGKDAGISYTEFSYMLLQAFDFYHLYSSENVTLQVGGSDQWGNITAGIHLINKKLKGETPQGLTLPLLLQKNGEKFGKSNGGTVWLDADRTSPYAFYQFWFSTPDDVVWDYIFQFILEPYQKLKALKTKLSKPNMAQEYLARAMTLWIHGPEKLDTVDKIRRSLFSGDLSQLEELEIKDLKNGGVNFCSYALDEPLYVLEALTKTSLCLSKGEAKRDINSRSIYIDGTTISSIEEGDEILNSLDVGCHSIRKGKKRHAIIEILP